MLLDTITGGIHLHGGYGGLLHQMDWSRTAEEQDCQKCFYLYIWDQSIPGSCFSEECVEGAVWSSACGATNPQANGLVERNNRTIQSSLLKVLGELKCQWQQALPGVLFAFNTSKNKSIGFTSFYLMCGLSAVLPVEVQAIQSQDVSSEAFGCDFDVSSLEEPLQFVCWP